MLDSWTPSRRVDRQLSEWIDRCVGGWVAGKLVERARSTARWTCGWMAGQADWQRD